MSASVNGRVMRMKLACQYSVCASTACVPVQRVCMRVTCCRYLSLCNILPALVQTKDVSMVDAVAQVMCDV